MPRSQDAENILWLIFGGLQMAAAHVVAGILLCLGEFVVEQLPDELYVPTPEGVELAASMAEAFGIIGAACPAQARQDDEARESRRAELRRAHAGG